MTGKSHISPFRVKDLFAVSTDRITLTNVRFREAKLAL
jgi:hypothetical protein